MGESTRPLQIGEAQNTEGTEDQLSMLADALRKSSPPPVLDGANYFHTSDSDVSNAVAVVLEQNLEEENGKKENPPVANNDSTYTGRSFALARERRRQRLLQESQPPAAGEPEKVGGVQVVTKDALKKAILQFTDPPKPKKLSRKAQQVLESQLARQNNKGFERLQEEYDLYMAEMKEEGFPRFNFSVVEVVTQLSSLGTDEDPVSFENVAGILLAWRPRFKAHFNDAFVDSLVDMLCADEGEDKKIADILQSVADPHYAAVAATKNLKHIYYSGAGEEAELDFNAYVGPELPAETDKILTTGMRMNPGDNTNPKK